jgi:HEAT repeat protein
LANELEQETFASFDFVAYALGLIQNPASEAALREAIERAEATPGAAAMARKAWVCWALGLHGEIDALKLVNEGTHQAAKFPIHRQMTVIEAIAVQTAPEAVGLLLQQLQSWGETEEKRGDLRFVVRALRRLGDPTSAPTLIEIVEQNEDQPALRAQAADALRSVETADSVAALVTALNDPIPGVRRAAAFALMWMDRPRDVKKLLELLTTEEDLRTREALYKIAAAHVQPEQISQFLEQWSRPDPEDRRLFIIALPLLKSEEKIPILIDAAGDPSDVVAMLAIGPLAASGGKAAMDRLQELLVSAERWNIVREIAKAASADGFEELAPGITRRLVDGSRLPVATTRGLMSASDKLAQALIDLRHTAGLAKLRRARKALTNPEMVEVFDDVIEALELIRANGKDVAKWVPLLSDVNPDHSRLARSLLAELGGEQATAALLRAYDEVDVLARLDILLILVEMDSPAVRGLLRRLLLEPESYEVEREGERKTAAWIARSFDDEEMLDLLIDAVRLREGRDIEHLIYVAAIAQKKALPLLREYRLSRLHYLGLSRGYEQEVLDWIIRRLDAGLSIERYDQPPTRLLVR